MNVVPLETKAIAMAQRRMTKPTVTKPSVKNRTLSGNAGGAGAPHSPFQEKDIKGRMGNYTGKGEHARQGGRTTGIVGQKKSRFRTDKAK
jgi:hypothetical protein